MSEQKVPPTELGQYVLRLVREFRDKATSVMILETVANRRQVLSSQAEVNMIRETLQPIIVSTFKQAESDLMDGKDPLTVLKEFFNKAQAK